MNIKKHIIGCALGLVLLPNLVHAHGGEDHAPEKPAAEKSGAASAPAGSEAPARLPDGSVFLPKSSQNLLGIRTVQAPVKEVRQTVELKGQVKADPSSGGEIQATQTGRIVGTKSGLPALGQQVKAGQILAWLEPVVGSLERSAQQSQLAQIQSQLTVAEQKLARYEQLQGIIPQKEVDAARAEWQALKQQKAAIAGGLSNRLPLTAPVSGVISKVEVTAGQVVEAKQTLFSIVDPKRLIVEALGYDTQLVGNIAAVSGATASGEPLKLSLLGTGLELREQALPVQLRVLAPAPALAVGQPVKVFVQLKQAARGAVVPVSAVSRDASGEQVVWVHTSAERFVARKVQTQALDAQTLVVTAGLAGGERVVTQGVASLAQIR
jgi:RND family efflux transporter MFP subunit